MTSSGHRDWKEAGNLPKVLRLSGPIWRLLDDESKGAEEYKKCCFSCDLETQSFLFIFKVDLNSKHTISVHFTNRIIFARLNPLFEYRT